MNKKLLIIIIALIVVFIFVLFNKKNNKKEVKTNLKLEEIKFQEDSHPKSQEEQEEIYDYTGPLIH